MQENACDCSVPVDEVEESGTADNSGLSYDPAEAQYKWSRWREVKADTYALQTTRNPQAFISAMTRLANQYLADAKPPAWVEFVLHSHPSIHKRVAMAQSFGVDE